MRFYLIEISKKQNPTVKNKQYQEYLNRYRDIVTAKGIHILAMQDNKYDGVFTNTLIIIGGKISKKDLPSNKRYKIRRFVYKNEQELRERINHSELIKEFHPRIGLVKLGI